MFKVYPELTSLDVTEAMAYYRIDPWGEERADLRAGIIASEVFNAADKHTERLTADKFMPNFGQTAAEEKTEEEIAQSIDNAMSSIAAQFG